jgi:transposase
MSQSPTRKYPAEFKERAVKLAVESEQSIAQTARDLGVNENTLHTWIGKYHRVERQEKEVQDEHLYEELKRLRKENVRLKEERDILKNLVRRAASLVSGETGVGEVSSLWGRSGRLLTGGMYHPVKKRGPGTLADVRVVTPPGDPVEEGDRPAIPPPPLSHKGGHVYGPSTPRQEHPPAANIAHRPPPCGRDGYWVAVSCRGGIT